MSDLLLLSQRCFPEALPPGLCFWFCWFAFLYVCEIRRHVVVFRQKTQAALSSSVLGKRGEAEHRLSSDPDTYSKLLRLQNPLPVSTWICPLAYVGAFLWVILLGVIVSRFPVPGFEFA